MNSMVLGAPFFSVLLGLDELHGFCVHLLYLPSSAFCSALISSMVLCVPTFFSVLLGLEELHGSVCTYLL